MSVYAINQAPSLCDQIKGIMESGSGVFQTQKFASDLFNLIEEIGRRTGHSWNRCKEVSGVCLNGALGITIPFAITSTMEVGQTAAAIANRKTPLTRVEKWEFVQKMATSAQMNAYTLSLFTHRIFWGALGDACSALDDTLDAMLAGDRLVTLSQKQTKLLSVDAKIYLDESKKLQCLKLAKAIMATAVGVFGLLGLYFGAPLIPAIALLTMAVTSSALAIFNRLYKMNMTYVPIITASSV